MNCFVRLVDLYNLEKEYSILRTVKARSINDWYIMWNKLLERVVNNRIEKQIDKAKSKANIKNKNSYLKFLKK